jgi:hypothetical protein
MNNKDLIQSGCKVQFYLSGNRNEDRFLGPKDMSESHWELLMGCYHQGACDVDVEEAARYFEVKDFEAIRENLKEFGAWDDSELADDEANLHRYLWTLSADIQEEQENQKANAPDCDICAECGEHAEFEDGVSSCCGAAELSVDDNYAGLER